MKKFLLSIMLLFVLLMSACFEDELTKDVRHYSEEDYAKLTEVLDLPEDPLDYTIVIPEALGLNNFSNTIHPDNDLATLGRVLFYDMKLSKNGKVSCASCHLPEHGFADNKALSEGFEGGKTRRNSLALGTTINFRTHYGGSSEPALFLWDERAPTISEQSRIAITDPVEMGYTESELIEELSQHEYLNILFSKAFFNEGIEFWMVTSALDEFVNTLTTTDSKFDRGLSGQSNFDTHQAFSNFTEEENLGKTLYNQHCASCHSEKFNTVVLATANNGLDLEYEDKGIGELIGPGKNGVFKIPSLRNIGLSAPYMHDGRFSNLEEVVDHYSEGIKDHQNLHFLLEDEQGKAKKLNFTEEEKSALVAFLNTLTDPTITVAKRFSDPFIR